MCVCVFVCVTVYVSLSVPMCLSVYLCMCLCVSFGAYQLVSSWSLSTNSTPKVSFMYNDIVWKLFLVVTDNFEIILLEIAAYSL